MTQTKNEPADSGMWRAGGGRLLDNPWGSALSSLYRGLRESSSLLITAALVGAILAISIKAIIPRQYKATAQVLIDPRGVNVKSGDLFSQLDANAAINFVESQMVVLKSDRVVARAIAATSAPRQQGEAAQADIERRLLTGAATRQEMSVLEGLQNALTVQRGDRSFVLNVTVANTEPQQAADLANAVVKAFAEVDNIDRLKLATRLKTDFDSRLEGLQDSVREANLAVEKFRRTSGLFGGNDRTALEWQLRQAIEALTHAQVREDQAAVRFKMLETAPTSLGILGPLGSDAVGRNLTAKLEALNKARAEEAAVAGVMGERHPQLQQARATVAALSQDVDALVKNMQTAAASELERGRNEVAALSARMKEVSEKLSEARGAEVELRALEVELDGRKKILESFQSRYREVREFSDIDASNIRVISPARAPNAGRPLPSLILWSMAGAIIGLLVICAALCLRDVKWPFVPAMRAVR